MNNEATFQNWDRGDIIRHKATGDVWMIDASNPDEWERVYKSLPVITKPKPAFLFDAGPVNVGDPVGHKDTLATRIAELREKTTAQIDDLTAQNDHLVTRNGVLEAADREHREHIEMLKDTIEAVQARMARMEQAATDMRVRISGKDREIDIKQDAIDAQERTITRLAKKKREASGCVYDLPEALEGTAPRHFRLGDVFDATIDLGSIEEITGPDLVGDGWGFTLYKRGDTTGFHWKCYDTEQAAREAYARLTAALCVEG